MTNKNLLIKVYKLNNRFNYQVDLSTPFIVILGENGSGKTSLLKLLAGLFNGNMKLLGNVVWQKIEVFEGKKKVHQLLREEVLEVDGKYFNESSSSRYVQGGLRAISAHKILRKVFTRTDMLFPF